MYILIYIHMMYIIYDDDNDNDIYSSRYIFEKTLTVSPIYRYFSLFILAGENYSLDNSFKRWHRNSSRGEGYEKFEVSRLHPPRL